MSHIPTEACPETSPQPPLTISTGRCVAFFAVVGPFVGAVAVCAAVLAAQSSHAAGSPFAFLKAVIAGALYAPVLLAIVLPGGYAIGLLPAMLAGRVYATILSRLKPTRCPSVRARLAIGTATGLVVFVAMRLLPLERSLSWLCLTAAVGTSLLMRQGVFKRLAIPPAASRD